MPFFFNTVGIIRITIKKIFLLALCYACQGFYSDSVILSIVFGSRVKIIPLIILI